MSERIGKNRYDVFAYLAQRVQSKLDNWYTHLLSPAGKEVLIKAVAIALPTYTMSSYLLPNRLLTHISSAIRKFWWSSANHKRKIAWVAWKDLTKSKKEGDLGIKDLQDFNIALLAKQGWRLLNNPNSLLAKLYKAKYYFNCSFSEAAKTNTASYAWKNILHTKPLFHRGLRWSVGTGQQINVWKDSWLPLVPSRPARGPGACTHPLLTVSDLIIPGTSQWDLPKLSQLLVAEDVPLVQQVRPSQTNVADYISWLYTPTGEYTVKSGYYVQANHLSQQIPSINHASDPPCTQRRLYSAIWKLDAPPKLKHFWWRIVHNSLPVADTLAVRGCSVNRQCTLCGDADETINHMLFQCRVSQEVWDLAPLPTPTGDCMKAQTLWQNLQTFLIPLPSQRLFNGIFPFIGWRLWKMRNNILFGKNKEFIPQLISKALIDYNLWIESKPWREGSLRSSTDHSHLKVDSIQASIEESGQLYCSVDASWTSPTHKIGIAWILCQSNGHCSLKGKNSLPPTSTPLEAKALALLSTVQELRKLNFQQVIFIGNCKPLYAEIERRKKVLHSQTLSNSPIGTFAQDIYSEASSFRSAWTYDFKQVPRKLLSEVAQLAKYARQHNSTCTIIWPTL